MAAHARGAPLADENIVLPPVAGASSSLPEKMLVFLPGGKVPTTNYVSTAKAIQAAASQLRLWVVIPAVFNRLCIIQCSASWACTPLHGAVESALDTAAGRGWKRGRDDTDLWMAGHSLAGVCANTLFQAYNSETSQPYAGLIVMGSYVDETGGYDLTHYPKPVLTLNTELDGGLARPGKTAVWWRQHAALQDAKGEDFAISQKPVIVLPGLNHSDFCPGFDVDGDLPAEVSQVEATAVIGSIVGAFLHARTAGIAAAVQASALDLIREKVAWTRTLLTPYLKAQDMERMATDTTVSAEGASSFCAKAQHIIAGLSASDDGRLAVTDGFHASSPDLEHCHPNWTVVEGYRLSTHTCSHTDYYLDLDNTGSITAASEIACKMLSSARLAQQLKTTADRPQVDCSAGNRHAVQVAESIAAPSTLARYRRAGRGWCFLDDTPTLGSIGPVWVFQSSLAMTDNATCMAVSSPVLKTELDSWVYPGNHYCKFLSPARVLDWMMTDSLKPAASLPEANPATSGATVVV